MSEMARKTREAMKDKARRMTSGGPHSGGSIDASGWTEPTDMLPNAQTGLRPVSRQMRKRGGKVEGCAPMARADRKPRKSGGRASADDYVNRNVKTANAEFGKPHEGGYARGGGANFRKQMHADVAEDKRLIKHMVKGSAIRSKKRSGGGQFVERPHKAGGGDVLADAVNRADKAAPRALSIRPRGPEFMDPAMLRRMDDLSKSAYVADAEDMNAESDARKSGLARKRGGRTHKAHGGSLNDESGSRPKGGRDARKAGGRAKGKTNIMIAIHSGQQQPQQMPMPPAPVRPPQVPPTPQAMPPQAPPVAGGMPGGLGAAGPQMPMMRKDGGRTMPTVGKAKRARSYKDMGAASRGGIGRLEKTAIAERA